MLIDFVQDTRASGLDQFARANWVSAVNETRALIYWIIVV